MKTPIVDSGLIELLYLLGEAAMEQPNPTAALAYATAEYTRRKEVIHRANHPNREANVAETCAAQVIGRRGGKRGGPARARKLTSARRHEIAKQAAEVRWSRVRKEKELA